MTLTPKASQQDQALALTMPSHVESLEGPSLPESSLPVPASSSIITGERTKRDRRRFLQAASALGAVGYSEIFGPLSSSLAEEPTPAGKVTAVDVKKATIAVGDATYKVHSTASVSVNGEKRKLRDVEPGMVVTLTFNSPRSAIRVVNRIEATGEREEPGTGDLPKGPVQTAPEGAGLPWIRKAFIQRSPAVGFNFYWTAQETPTSTSVLWKATLEAGAGSETTHQWTNPEPLFPAIECTECGGINVVVCDGGPLLHAARTKPPRGPLSQPRPISDVKTHGLLRSPKLLADGQYLYCDRVDGETVQPVIFKYNDSRTLWDFDTPTEVKVPLHFKGRLRNFCPLSNGRVIACLQDQNTPGPTVFLLSGGNGVSSFTSCSPVLPADPKSGDIRGFSPSWLHSTKCTELFLTGIGPAKDGSAAFIFKVKVKDLLE